VPMVRESWRGMGDPNLSLATALSCLWFAVCGLRGGAENRRQVGKGDGICGLVACVLLRRLGKKFPGGGRRAARGGRQSLVANQAEMMRAAPWLAGENSSAVDLEHDVPAGVDG
jgi:hypothetical protein